MVFHICGIVVLTLVINGSTIQYVLKLLKIKSSLYQSDFLIKSSLEHLAKKSDHLVNVLSQNNHFTGANWLELRNSIPDYSRLLKTENYGIGGQNEHSVESNIRYRFICSMKSFYWKQHQDGLINSHTYNILNDAAEASIDCNDIKEQWTCIKKHFKYPRWYQFLHSKRFFKNFSHKSIFGIILETVQLSTAFIFAADRTGIIVKKFPEWKSNLTDKVFAEIKAAEKLAELEIHRIQKTFPEIYQSIQSQKASVFVLNSDIKNINRLRKDGIIQTSECEEMTDRVNTFIHKVGSCYKIPAKINTFLLFSNLPFISVFDEQTKHILFAKLRYKVFSEEETLYTEGKNKNSFFLIVRGLVKINTSDHYERIYGPGSLINLWASLAESTSISTCRAQTTTSVLKVPKTVIHSILRERTTEEIAWKCAAFMMMRMLFTTRLELESDHVKLGEICLSSTFRKFESDTDELVGSKVLLLKGKDVVGKVYIAPALIQSIQTKSLQRINSVTVNRMRVRFSKSVALILDSKGSPFRQTLEDIANVSEESMSELNRNESLGLIYIKGSTESTRTHLSSTNV
ncbi:hypothetical protein MHBO_000136 [Bonamia ostreae]|uniref:Cyclic nucleotide-binding domain-containing protein n=1 Tax=Bonamia ostreae TaxID=126728 RepID=A0ABV2AF77_9EUKA